MIIPDEDDLLKSKDPPTPAPTLRYPERAAGRRPFSPLPDYETSQALAFNDFSDSLITLHKPPPKRRILDSRFWKAAVAALALYIFLTIAIGIPIIVKKTREAAQQSYPYYPSNYVLPRPNKIPSSQYTDIDDINYLDGVFPVCNSWANVDQLADVQNSLIGTMQNAISSNGQFSITSNASYLSMNIVQGDLFVGINPNTSETDATVSITMQASSTGLFDQTVVCLLSSTNLTTLSLLIPENLALADQLLFNITLLFPQSAIPSNVDAFATFLPLFTQTFDDFGNYVIFKKISIEGPVSKIFATSLQADKMLVETALEPIFGQFYATDTLTISTINAPLTANITLYNDPDSNFPTYLEVSTGNSDLIANVTLNSPSKNSPLRPNFLANLRTFSGATTASFVHDSSSPPTIIKLRVENDLGQSDVTIDEKYQGVFQVTTKLGNAAVTRGTAYSSDPWAQDQQRNLLLDYSSPVRTFGWIGWGSHPEFDEQQGEVVVETSIANCTLSFAG